MVVVKPRKLALLVPSQSFPVMASIQAVLLHNLSALGPDYVIMIWTDALEDHVRRGLNRSKTQDILYLFKFMTL